MHHSNIPLAGSSPLELLKAGAFIAGQADFDLILPYQVFVVKVFRHENFTYQDHFFYDSLQYSGQDFLTTHIHGLQKFKQLVKWVNCLI